jgi:hypothetical protein
MQGILAKIIRLQGAVGREWASYCWRFTYLHVSIIMLANNKTLST